MFKRILFISAIALFAGAKAQKTHTVGKGDNPYNVAKKYGLTLDELVKLNPAAKDGKLSIGDVLVVSKKTAAAPAKKPAVTEKPVASATLGKIILQPKQTVYGITKQYHISEAELRRLNPNLDSNMKIGSEIVLPAENIIKYGGSQAATTTAETVKTAVASDSYEIQPKDNYYRITKQFGITKDQLFALNPGLEAKGLQPGDIIRVKGQAPKKVKEVVSDNASSAEPTVTTPIDDAVTHKVQDGDTVFGIINKYGVTLDELLALNPELSNGLKAGMVLKIRKADQAYSKVNGDALSVVLMLPFGFDTNDSKFRNMSADFLSGAKLAIERNAARGQKLEVKVIDAGNEASFKNSLSQINQNNTDLIIGPFLKSNIKEVLNFVGNKKIPVVAPFANSEELYGYSNLIIVEPSDNVYAHRIAKEVSQVYSNQKIYILADSDRQNANLIKSTLEGALSNPNIAVVSSAADIQADKNMMTGQNAPVIAILANSDDAAGTAFANRVIALTKEVSGVKAFSMFYNSIFEKKQDELSAANLVYLMDRKIASEGSFEREILSDYKQKYCKTPPKYAIIGFDVVNDILSRENKNGEVFKQIGKVQTQLATKFEYVRVKPNGAYINNGYRVVRLLPQ